MISIYMKERYTNQVVFTMEGTNPAVYAMERYKIGQYGNMERDKNSSCVWCKSVHPHDEKALIPRRSWLLHTYSSCLFLYLSVVCKTCLFHGVQGSPPRTFPSFRRPDLYRYLVYKASFVRIHGTQASLCKHVSMYLRGSTTSTQCNNLNTTTYSPPNNVDTT